MALLAKPLREVSQGAAQPFLRGLALDAYQPIAAPAPVVREAEVVHRRWAVPRLECLPRTLFAKGEEVRLVGVQAQTEFPVGPKYSNSLSYRKLRFYHHPPFSLSSAPLSPILSVKRDGKT
jgi:hypothetical protein